MTNVYEIMSTIIRYRLNNTVSHLRVSNIKVIGDEAVNIEKESIIEHLIIRR